MKSKKNEDINTSKKSITHALLEKYRPKVLSSIETLGEKESSKESGLRLWIRIQSLGMDLSIYTIPRKKDGALTICTI